MSRNGRKALILLTAILIAVAAILICFLLMPGETPVPVIPPPAIESTPEPVQETPAPEIIASVRYCESDGRQIYGMLFAPKAQEPVPLIIYAHGLGGSHEEAAGLAEYAVSQGMALYAFDFRGGSLKQRSEGDPLDMSLLTEVCDLTAVIAQARQWREIDPERIVLVGHSQGGAVAAITAARYPEDIDGLVLLAPAFMLPEYTRQIYASKEDIDDSRDLMGMKVGRTYFESIWDYDIYADIGAYRNMVLIIHGDADSTVPIEYSQKALSVYDNADLIVFPGGGHHAFWSSGEETLSHISTYLKKIGFDGGITE